MTYFVLLLQLETINKSHKYPLKKNEGTYSCPYILKIQSYISLSVKYISFFLSLPQKEHTRYKNNQYNMEHASINDKQSI